MQIITTTELRTKSKELVKALREGRSINLIHRSRVVGEINPKTEPKPLSKADIKKIEELAKALSLPKMTYREREKRYRKHLMKKYGKGLS